MGSVRRVRGGTCVGFFFVRQEGEDNASEEEAAEAYDLAAIKLKGPTAMTNFDVSRYLNHPHDGRHQKAEAAAQAPPQPQPKQEQHHLLRPPQPAPLNIPVAPPPPAAAGAGTLAGEQFLALPVPEIAAGDLGKDVQPWALCMDPTGFDPFQAPVAMGDVDSGHLDGLYDPTCRFEDDVEGLFEEMERQVRPSYAHGNGACGGSSHVAEHVTGGSGRGDHKVGAGEDGEVPSSSSSSADSNRSQTELLTIKLQGFPTAAGRRF